MFPWKYSRTFDQAFKKLFESEARVELDVLLLLFIWWGRLDGPFFLIFSMFFFFFLGYIPAVLLLNVSKWNQTVFQVGPFLLVSSLWNFNVRLCWKEVKKHFQTVKNWPFHRSSLQIACIVIYGLYLTSWEISPEPLPT